jgi:hypothetical protein
MSWFCPACQAWRLEVPGTSEPACDAGHARVPLSGLGRDVLLTAMGRLLSAWETLLTNAEAAAEACAKEGP